MIVCAALIFGAPLIMWALDRAQSRREVYARAVAARAEYDRDDPDAPDPWLIHFPYSAELDAIWKRGLGEKPR